MKNPYELTSKNVSGKHASVSQNNIDYNFKVYDKVKKFEKRYGITPLDTGNPVGELDTDICLLNDEAYWDEPVHAVNIKYVDWTLAHAKSAVKD